MLVLGKLVKLTKLNTCGIDNIILLDPRKSRTIKVGRDPAQNDVHLDSKQKKCMISRMHAVLQYDNRVRCWIIRDNNSTNGVYVNGVALKTIKMKQTRLSSGDVVVFGVNEDTSEFKYKFEVENLASGEDLKRLQEECAAIKRKAQAQEEKEREVVMLKRKLEQERQLREREGQRLRALEEQSKKEKDAVKRKWEEIERMTKDEANKAKRMKILEKERLELQEKLRQEEKAKQERERLMRESAEREKAAAERIKRLQEENKKKEETLQNQIASLMANQSEMNRRLKERKAQEVEAASAKIRKMEEENKRREKERADLEAKLAKMLQQTKADKDAQARLKAQITKLNEEHDSERKEFEEKVRKVELSKQEAVSAIEREKKEEAEKLKKQIETLGNQASHSAEDKKKLDELRKQLEGYQEGMSEELECSVCFEYFIDSRTLSCSHSFCEQCITDHLQRKDDCPHCRSKVGVPWKSVTVDNMVNRLTAKLPEADKKEREKVLDERRKTATRNKATCNTLRRSIERARKAGSEFFDIQRVWQDQEKDTYSKGLANLKLPEARLIYAATVGLSNDSMEAMNAESLARAARNLRMKEMSTDSVAEQRRKLRLFVNYGTKIFLDSKG
mmetsp:Transcript_3818/g.7254  ORF Transcript_3818/g.7254 Transcript_3818/m.7254 type:complete len:620 (-) Transcript_3818:105-1964(-)